MRNPDTFVYLCGWCCVCWTELAVSIEAQQGTKTLLAAGGNNTEYLDLAKKGGGHNGRLIILLDVSFL